MFFEKYLDTFDYNLLLDNYDNDFLETMDEGNFIQILNVFKKYNFYFTDDIILNFLEIFLLEPEFVERKIIDLQKQLGDNFAYLIGNDLRYLNQIG